MLFTTFTVLMLMTITLARSPWAGLLPRPQSAHPCSLSSWLLTVPLPGWHPPDWQGFFARMETASSEQLIISALLFAAIKSRTMAPVHCTSLAGINMPYGKESCMGGPETRSFPASVKSK